MGIRHEGRAIVHAKKMASLVSYSATKEDSTVLEKAEVQKLGLENSVRF